MTAVQQEVSTPAAPAAVPALQACPFCHGPAAAGTIEENGIHFAGCADPDCIGYHIAYDFVTVAAAAAAWNNRRAPPPRHDAALPTAAGNPPLPGTDGPRKGPAFPPLDDTAKAAELVAFQAWLQEDELADGCRGLSQLERDQMRDAWLARAARGAARLA